MRSLEVPDHLAALDLAALPAGSSLGRFLLRSHLGRGGFGSVWRVEDPLRPGADLALKVLERGAALAGRHHAARVRGAAIREFRLGSLVRHPAINEVLETGLLDRKEGTALPYLLSDFFPGIPLRPPWSAEPLSAIAAELLSALDAIHAAGWRHGDLQPGNILVRAAGGGVEGSDPAAVRYEARLLDFGLATELGSGAGASGPAGTPLYLAPEILKGKRPDHRADLYSLGLLLYECLHGPIAERLGEHLQRTHRGDFHREVAAAKIPGDMGRLILRLLEPEPEARLSSGAEGLAILEGGAGAAVRAPLSVPSFEAPLPVGREPLFAAIAAALRATRRRPSLFFVTGARGLGKTRVIEESLRRAFISGRRGWSWSAASAAARLESRESGADEGGVGSALFSGEGPGEEGSLRRAEAILRAIGREPSLLAVDDAHLLDREDLQALRSLAEMLRNRTASPARSAEPFFPPIIVITSAGNEKEKENEKKNLPGGLERLLDLPWASTWSLAPWTAEEMERCLDQVLPPGRNLGPAEEMVARQAGGIPSRLRFVLRELARRGELHRRDGTWVCERTPSRGPVPLADDRERFLEEWSRLAGAEQRILALLAVAAEGESEPSIARLAAAAGEGPERVEQILRELRERGGGTILAPGSPATGSAPGAAPRVDRLRRGWILRRLGPEGRARSRELWCAAAADPVEGLRHRARRGLASVAEILAAARGGGAGGERLLAGHALLSPAGIAERSRSGLALGEALHRRGEVRRARRWLEFSLQGLEEPLLRARVETLLAECAILRRDLPEGKRRVEAAEGLGALGPSEGGGETELRLLFARATIAYLSGDLAGAEAAAREGLGRAGAAGPFLNLLGNAALGRGDRESARSHFQRALREAQSRGDRREAAVARTHLGRLLLREGRAEEAARLHREAARDYRLAGVRSQEALALSNLGAALRRAGDFASSLEAQLAGLALQRELGNDTGRAVAEANLAILARELGLPGTASRRFRAAAEAAAGAGEGVAARLEETAPFAEARALLDLDLGRAIEGRGCLDRLARRSTVRHGEKRPERRDDAPAPLSADALLIVARAGASGSPFPEGLHGAMRDSLLDGALDGAAAPALHALASREPIRPEAGGPGAGALAPLALDRLRRLSRESPRAAFYLALREAEQGSDSPRRAAAENALRAAVALFPEREARRRALVHLARASSGEEGARWRGLLRRLLDEVSFDLDPSDREAFAGRAEIQEAMAVSKERESGAAAPERSQEILRRLLRFNQEILSETDVEELVPKIIDAAIELTGAERGFLALRREGAFSLAAARSRGKDLADPESQLSRTILDQTLTEGSPRLATDAREEAALRSIASVEELQLRSVICVPLRGKRRILGALYLDNPYAEGVFDPEDLELAESFCAQAALAFLAAENRARLRRLLGDLRDANRRLDAEVQHLRLKTAAEEGKGRREFLGMGGDSPAIREVFHWIEVVAPTDLPVLIAGESGTGKELAARAIHRLSRRSQKPFIAENCAAVPASLLESALFGHVKGAFTGADSNRAGLFEMADGGTLFLDEIGELPTELQTRLLRVLQEGEVRPIGSQRLLRVNVRVVAATNRDVRGAIAEGRFRQDLYYRLQGAEIHLPPLRERPGDVPLLAAKFLEGCRGQGTPAKRLAPETLEKLARYSWPGNVRELENEVRRLALLSSGEVIGPEYLSPAVREGLSPPAPGLAAKTAAIRPLKEVEGEAIRAALERHEGHRGKVAEALGISRSTLYLKLREMGYRD